MIRQTRNHFLHLQVALRNATREQPPTREMLRLIGISAYKGTPFLVNYKPLKTTIVRSISKVPVNALAAILEGTQGITITTDLQDLESASGVVEMAKQAVREGN